MVNNLIPKRLVQAKKRNYGSRKSVVDRAHGSVVARLRCNSEDNVLENPAPMFVVVELIETSAGRSQEHHIAGACCGGGAVDSGIKSFRVYDLRRP